MSLPELKSKLMAAKPWPLCLMKQGAALKALLASRDPGAAEILAAAVDSGHRLTAKIRPVLAASTAPAWIGRLCDIWVDKRQDWLGRMIKDNKWATSTIGKATICILKTGQVERLSTDPSSVSVAVQCLGDSDVDVRVGVHSYVRGLPDEAPLNDKIYEALVRTKNDVLAKIVREQRRVPGTIGEDNAWWILKTGLQDRLPSEVRVTAAVLAHVADGDAEVSAGAMAYVSRLPDEARHNDAIYDAWIRTQSGELRDLITGQKRLPSSVAKETLLCLCTGDVDGYLAMQDENGQIFREAWGLAPEPLRQQVARTVTGSGNRRLIDAYTKALGQGGQVDASIELEARKTAGDEDGLFEACRSLKIFELLDQCARWEETGNRPTDPGRKRALENALAAWREVGRIEFDEAPELPEGLVDFFDADLDSKLDSPDPLMRLHAAVNGKGSPDPQEWIKSKAWPERLAARLLDPTLVGEPDHVEWTSLTGGMISDTLLTTTAEGTLAEHQTLLQLLETNSGRSGRAAAINRGLAGVLVAFQGHFLRGSITIPEDDSAEDQAAIQVGDEIAAEDLKF